MERRRNREWLNGVIRWFSYLLLLGNLTPKYQKMLKELITEKQEITNRELMEAK